MSAPLEQIRRYADRDVEDHTAIFDLYVTVGRDVEYLSIKFGMDPEDLIYLLEGYGETIRLTPGHYDGDDPRIHKSLKEFGIALDDSGRGRLPRLPRVLVEEYVGRFYPGIASENPQNDWICIESYLEHMHPGWQVTLQQAEDRGAEGTGRSGKKRSRSGFRLFG